MKKFLTVLLVIAVMFTFSFSSAFAAVNDADKLTYEQVVEKITTAANAAKVTVERAKDAALYDIFVSKTTAVIDGVDVSKASVEKVYNDVIYTPAIVAIEQKLEAYLDAAEKALTIDPSTHAAYTASAPFSGYFNKTGTTVSDTSGAVYPGFSTDFSAATFSYDADNNGSVSGSTEVDVAATSINSNAFLNLFNDADSAPGTTAPTGSYDKEVGQQAFKDAKEATLTAIRAIDLTAYSKEYNNQMKSNYDIAAESVAAAIEAINGLTVTTGRTGTTWDQAKGKITATSWTSGKADGIYAVYKEGVNQADPTGYLATGGLLAAPYNTSEYGLNNLEKIADEPTSTAKLEWAKAKVLTALTTQINNRLNTTLTAKDNEILSETVKGAKADADKIAAAKVAKEEAKEQADAALEIVKYFVGECDSLSQLITTNAANFGDNKALVYGWDGITSEALWAYNVDGSLVVDKKISGTTNHLTYSAADMVKITKRVAELKAEADVLKASVMIDGAEYVAIEDALEDAIEACYKIGTVTDLALSRITLDDKDAQVALWDRQDDLMAADTVKINGRKYNGTGLWKGTLDVTGTTPEKNNGTYDKDLFDEVRAAVKETNAAIVAAKTIEEADAAFLAGFEKFDAIRTNADRTSAQATKEFVDLKAKYEAELTAYIDYKESAIASVATDYSWTKSRMLTNLKAELAKAYTTEELTAAYTDAKAEIDGLKTKAELEAAKKAIDARVAAVKNVTVADRETIDTLIGDIEDHNDYCELIGNVGQKVVIKTVVYSAMDTIQKAEAREIQDAIKAIGTVTLEDADAIAAVQAKLDAYVAFYAGEDAEDSTIANLKRVNYLGTTVADLQNKLEACKVAEFKAMVGKLPADGSDVAGIKAARAAYEKLTRASQKAVYRDSQFDKLLDLEKVIGSDENAKAYVQDLKIAARSTKTSKGVKVTIKADVQPLLDAGYTVEYKFYRSTKSNAKFGSPKITKTTNTYLNTSGKKGTRYYYKARLVVKNAKGEVVAITPLTQCLYATRTF